MRIVFTLENHSQNGEILLCEFLKWDDNGMSHCRKKKFKKRSVYCKGINLKKVR